ncbi:MAG: aspartate kinase, partial [Gammaproteobacteria bacterium]|nr:aspartate kinase [Gammaproteobacteria bacterium]
MPLIVEKYGGTSVADPERIDAVARNVAASAKEGHQMVVVVSAMRGETDRLLALAREVNAAPSSRELDVLLATGEQVTIALLSMALHAIGVQAKSYTGAQIRILTDPIHGKARITDIQSGRARRDLEQGKVVVVAGFQGVDPDDNITTLGRGGSDT